jgi:hypothetical protein
MREIPVLFQPEMITAIDAGRKTMTRRLAWAGNKAADGQGFYPSAWQKLKAGDRLWVRERHWRWGYWIARPDGWKLVVQPATMGDVFFGESPPGKIGSRNDPPRTAGWHCRPSIFLPRVCSRFTLLVVATKIEPLQDISDADALAEGVERPEFRRSIRVGNVGHDYQIPLSYRGAFANLWTSIHGGESWVANPDVVATSFKLIRANIDQVSPPAQTHIGKLAVPA